MFFSCNLFWTYVNSGFNTDFMWVNEARLTNSRNTASAKSGGVDGVTSSVAGIDEAD